MCVLPASPLPLLLGLLGCSLGLTLLLGGVGLPGFLYLQSLQQKVFLLDAIQQKHA